VRRPQLPPNVDPERITARITDGELIVSIPKTEQPRPHSSVVDVM
jgi:HSP20 family molecular chaperone IbpA